LILAVFALQVLARLGADDAGVRRNVADQLVFGRALVAEEVRVLG
jgi:hypothetical protein